jgi:predicted RND superfamily exporter protein
VFRFVGVQRVLLWCVLVFLLGGYCAVGISRIRFDVDITKLLPDDLPEAAGARTFMKHFLKRSQVLLMLEGKTAEEVNAAAERVAQALEAKPNLVERVVWRRADDDAGAWTEFAAWALLNQPEAVLRGRVEAVSEARLAGTLEAYVEELATSPFLQEGLAGYDPLGLVAPLMAQVGEAGESSEFASADGLFRVLYVDLKESLSDYRAVAVLLGKLREVAEAAAAGGATLRMTGEPAFLAEISHSMEGDMKRSAITTLLLTTLLVWLVFRRVRLLPMLALCLGLIFALTLATCGLIMGSITALTVGFGSILIGLSADYGVLLFQAYQREGGNAVMAVKQVRGGVFWAMATTAAVFLALLPLGFPGLSDLGLLVAAGVGIGAVVMLVLLPKLLGRWLPIKAVVTGSWSGQGRGWGLAGVAAVLVLVGCAVGLIVKGLPKVDAASGSIRPRGSEAYAAIERLEEKLGGGPRALSLVVAAESVAAMPERIAGAKRALEALKGTGAVTGFALPEAFWPVAERQQANLKGSATELVTAAGRLKAGVMEVGFTEEAWALAGGILTYWERWAVSGVPTLPENAGARWMVERFLSIQADGECALLGLLQLGVDTDALVATQALPEGCYLAGGDVMTRTLDRYLAKGFTGISILFAGITLVLLAAALRAWRPFVLVTLCLGVSYAALLGLMAWLDLRWHAFTLPALLLSLGTGSDYFIHLILRLQRGASAAEARGALGPALIVCAGSSVLGFGSLITASSSGLASMGVVCAAALGLNLLAALLVMPSLWEAWRGMPRKA